MKQSIFESVGFPEIKSGSVVIDVKQRSKFFREYSEDTSIKGLFTIFSAENQISFDAKNQFGTMNEETGGVSFPAQYCSTLLVLVPQSKFRRKYAIECLKKGIFTLIYMSRGTYSKEYTLNFILRGVPYQIHKRFRWLNFYPIKTSVYFFLFNLLFLLRKSSAKKNKLSAIYDLAHHPVTYDFLWFCVGAELYRRENSFDEMEIIIVTGKNFELREEAEDYQEIVDHNDRIWRINNILTPIALSMCGNPSLKILEKLPTTTITKQYARSKDLFPVRRRKNNYPVFDANEYFETNQRLKKNGLEPFFTSGFTGQKYVQNWKKKNKFKDKLVVITIRYYGYMRERNSNINAWAEFAKSVDKNVFSIIFVLDTDSLDNPEFDKISKELNVNREASFSLQMRLALYESAYVNMFVNTGPGSLCILNAQCDYLYFKQITPSAPMATSERLTSFGIMPGKTPGFATKFQKFVWLDDDVENLKKEFTKFVQMKNKLEKHHSNISASTKKS